MSLNFLNDIKFSIPTTNKTNTSEFFDYAASIINISEADKKYFGVAFKDTNDQYQFLPDLEALIDFPLKNLYFAVKIFPNNPISAFESSESLYLLFLELKSQLLSGRLPFTNQGDCIKSFAYLLHFTEGYFINEKMFLILLQSLQYNQSVLEMNKVSDDEFKKSVCKEYKSFQKLSKSEAFVELMNLFTRSAYYGCRFFHTKDKLNGKCLLGLSNKAIFVIYNQTMKAEKEILWKDIQTFHTKREWLTIEVNGHKNMFFATNETSCKVLYSAVIMNHQEFLSQTSVSNLTLDKNDILRRLDLYFSKDNSLSLSKTNSTNTISSKAEEDAKTFMALKRKKIELEIELLEKLESLKSICIKEAELTGLMPKEIYLTLIKNEPLPCVNKRVGTSFKISSDILRNLTNAKENSKVVKMEADVDVLRSIAIAEKLLSRDKSVNRSVRKQRINRLNVTNDKIKAMENSLTQARNSISKPEVGSSLFMKRDNHSTISCPATPTSSLDPLKRNSRSFRTKKLFGL